MNNTSITSNQTEQVATFTADAARSGARSVMERVAKIEGVSRDSLQARVIEKGNELTKFVSHEVEALLEGKLLAMLMIMLDHLKVIMAGSVKISAMPRMKVVDCLKQDGVIIGWRDGDLDGWLSKYVPAMPTGTINCLELTKPEGTTFRQMAEAVLGMTGVDDAELKKALRERGMTFHPEQARDLITRTEAKEETGFHKDGKVNLLFIEDENGEVFGLRVLRSDFWSVFILSFDLDDEWVRGNRFFSRNMPAQAGKV